MDPSLRLLGTPPRVISAGLFPESVGFLHRVFAWCPDSDTVLYWYELEPASVDEPETRYFSRLRSRR